MQQHRGVLRTIVIVRMGLHQTMMERTASVSEELHLKNCNLVNKCQFLKQILMSVKKQFKVVSQYVHKIQHAGTFQGHTTALVLLASLWLIKFAYVSTYSTNNSFTHNYNYIYT